MILNVIKELKINISWKMIYIGLCNGNISTYEVVDYAMKQIERGDTRPEIFELAGAYADDYEYILGLVQDLVEVSLDESLESRKIRLAIVFEKIKNKNRNFVDGLIELTELWDSLGFPEDSPHIVQGVNNTLSPNEYYSQENYDELYRLNYEWFMKEWQYLQNK